MLHFFVICIIPYQKAVNHNYGRENTVVLSYERDYFSHTWVKDMLFVGCRNWLFPYSFPDRRECQTQTLRITDRPRCILNESNAAKRRNRLCVNKFQACKFDSSVFREIRRENTFLSQRIDAAPMSIFFLNSDCIVFVLCLVGRDVSLSVLSFLIPGANKRGKAREKLSLFSMARHG